MGLRCGPYVFPSRPEYWLACRSGPCRSGSLAVFTFLEIVHVGGTAFECNLGIFWPCLCPLL